MPSFDGMGPQGAGPGTGRRRGKCFNQDLPGGQFYGRRGMGRGRGGFGRGYGRGGYGRAVFRPVRTRVRTGIWIKIWTTFFNPL